jgi:hypothetical protein
VLWEPYQSHRASLETIAKWAATDGNVGIVTGAISGLVVLDLDSADAVAEAHRRGLPASTVVVKTARGEHWYFRHPGGTIRNGTNVFPGADFRGDGGYVVGAGSIHETGVVYTYHQPPGLVELAEMPKWLLDLVTKPANSAGGASEPKWETEAVHQCSELTTRYGASALEREVAVLRQSPEGERNNQLNKSAFAIAQLSAGGQIDEQEAIPSLRAAGLAAGLLEQEVDATLASGWKAGLALPRIPQGRHEAAAHLGEDTEEWSDPLPFPDKLLPVPPFLPEMLPTNLRDWVVDIAERMNVPLDFVGIPAMVALGGVIGRRAGIKPQANTDWMETANLWGCIVARPGAAKSPVLSQVLAPINRLETKAAREHAEAIKLHNAGQSVLKLERGAVEKQIKDALEAGVSPSYREQATQRLLGLEASEVPSERRFMTSDCTAEKLGEICAANPDGVLVHRDELMTMFADLDREEKASARGFFLSGWGGNQGYTFDRIGRGTIRIPAVNLSVIGTSQPKRLGAYIASSLRNLDDGMVQRLQLMSMPDLNGQFVEADRPPDAQARGRAFECFEGLALKRFAEIGAQRDPDTGEEGVPFFRFSEAARQAFSDWRTGLEHRLGDPDLAPALAAHLSKYRGLIPRIALICHLASGGEGAVSAQALKQALVWAEYLEAHARRIYAMAPSAESSLAARTILRKIQSGQLADGFTARDIKQKGWAGLRDPEVRAGLELLVELDWLRKIDVCRNVGRPTAIYRVNPRALTGPAKR